MTTPKTPQFMGFDEFIARRHGPGPCATQPLDEVKRRYDPAKWHFDTESRTIKPGSLSSAKFMRWLNRELWRERKKMQGEGS